MASSFQQSGKCTGRFGKMSIFKPHAHFHDMTATKSMTKLMFLVTWDCLVVLAFVDTFSCPSPQTRVGSTEHLGLFCKLLQIYITGNPPTPLPARGRRWGSVRLALKRDCGSLLPSLSPSPVQPCTLPAFFLSLFSCSSSFLFFPFPFCCRRTPLALWTDSLAAYWTQKRPDVRAVWTDSLAAYWTQTRR